MSASNSKRRRTRISKTLSFWLRHNPAAGGLRLDEQGWADLDFRPVEPPTVLFHGTTRERYARILASGGLAKMRRHHVHLSPDLETALRVARRHHGETPHILCVDVAAMVAAGYRFFVSEN